MGNKLRFIRPTPLFIRVMLPPFRYLGSAAKLGLMMLTIILAMLLFIPTLGWSWEGWDLLGRSLYRDEW